jgi:hypothetical protein
VGYAITITGTGSSGTLTTPAQDLTVLAVTSQFTLTVQSPVVPSSVPAGSGGQAIILLNPLNGYNSPEAVIGGKTIKGITLSCASITPLVTIAPVCSFDPPNPPLTGAPVTSILTISTYGPIVTGALPPSHNSHTFFAFWMFPMLGIVGAGTVAGGKRSRRIWMLVALLATTGALLLVPACGNTGTTTTTPNGVTPNNTYTFTVVGVDADGAVSSNTASASSANPTVTLTVTSPTK